MLEKPLVPTNEAEKYSTISPSMINSECSGMDLSKRPQVLQNKYGKVQWRLQGYSLEENLRIGIQNIQALFLDFFPEFEDSFPRGVEGTIEITKRDQAKQFILMKLRGRSLASVFGGSIISRVSAPYFNGSITYGVQLAFREWGIDLEAQTFQEKKKLVMSTLYDDEGNTWVTTDQLRERYNLDYRTIYKYLKNVISRNSKGLNGRPAKYFLETEAIEELRRIIDLPKANLENQVIIDENGKKWVSSGSLASLMNLNRSNISRLLVGLDSITGRNIKGNPIQYYDEVESLKRLQRFYQLPFVNKDNVFHDENGEAWAVVNNLLSDKLQMNIATLKANLERVRKIKGRNKRGRLCFLYNLQEAIEKLEAVKALPKVDRNTNKFTDEKGQSWMPLSGLSVVFNLTNSYFTNDRLAGIRVIQGRGKNGVICALYNESEARQRFQQYSLNLMVDREGQYRSQDNISWVNAFFLSKRLGLSVPTVKSYLRSAKTMQGRNTKNRFILLYDEQESLAFLHGFATLPRIDTQTRLLIDEAGAAWTTVTGFSKISGISSGAISFRLRSLEFKNARDKQGKLVKLYQVDKLKTLIGKFPIRRRFKAKERDSTSSPVEANLDLDNLLEI